MGNSLELQGETFPQLLLQRLKHDAERPAMRETGRKQSSF